MNDEHDLQYADAVRRAMVAEARSAALAEEIVRVRTVWRTALLAVVVVALLAILMLGVVAFNAVDEPPAGRDVEERVTGIEPA